jgi:redox-sensitive bicupin YhaK (pirin superfamily)
MDSPQQRRSFLARLGAGIGTLIALPFVSAARSFKENIDTNELQQRSPISNLSPMGFQWETADPFLFCVHHEDHFPKGNGKMGPAGSMAGRSLGDDFIVKDGYRMYHGKTVPGFPGHPHRGFETITVVRDGIVDHADSLGAAGRYGFGDVQWMTAGSGVQHSEMFPLLQDDKPNPMELFQIWLNLPKKNKMVPPHFTMLWSESIPNYTHKTLGGKNTIVEVIAGKIEQMKAPSPPPDSWASDPANEVAVWNIRMEPGAEWTLPKASAGINRKLYYYIGQTLNINGTTIPKYHSMEVQPDAVITLKNGTDEGRILVLQGRPIGEQVMQYGPFVMNTKEEIQQAFDDYHRTQFGGWPWPRRDQVHDRSSGRFALHADGRKEVKG